MRRRVRIADHLHLSKPTLLDWNHKHQSELAATKANHERSAQRSQKEPVRRGEGQGEGFIGKVGSSEELQLEHLICFHTTLRQEITKRTLQTLSDDELQTVAEAIEHQIEKLRGLPSEAKEHNRGGCPNRVGPNGK